MSDNFTSRVDVYKRAAENKSLESLVEIARLIYSTLENKGTVFAAGNGGSAAEASHFVAELVGRFIPSDRKSLRAVSLNSDMPSITAIGNDYGFQEIFSRQLSGLATPGDLVICFSTSGTSENILRLIETARELRVKVVLFTGEKLNKILPSCNVIFNVESSVTALIQEVHLSAIHMLCSYLEEAYAGKSGLNDEPKILQLSGLETSPSIREEIVWVNGCFDLLHKGHISFLKDAAQYGKELWVGLNSDESVRKTKGLNRPIQNQDDRAQTLALLPWVHKIVIFNEQDPNFVLSRIKPGIIVKSDEYMNREIPELEVIKDEGIKIVYLKNLGEISTSLLVNRILTLNK